MSKDERSAGGSQILRHQAYAPPAKEIAHADLERIAAHYDGMLGGKGMVWHEIVSDRIHVDVHLMDATSERPFHVLATSGMSARAMSMPPQMPRAEQEKWSHAELCILLPPDWPMEGESFKDDRHYWPIRLLKQLARLPHDLSTWLGWGHSIPNGQDELPYGPGTTLAGAVLVPPFMLGEAFFSVPGDPPLHVFQVLPITAKEMKLKLDKGLDGLLERLEAGHADIYGPIDPARKSVA